MTLPTKSRTYVREPEPRWEEWAEYRPCVSPKTRKAMYSWSIVGALIWAAGIWMVVRRWL